MILAIETSNPVSGRGRPSAGVALVTREGADRVNPVEIEWLRPTGRHEDDLVPAIDRVSRRAGIGPGELSRVAVSIGPGGYTGLRVAVTVGSMIAEVAGCACVGVPTAEALIRRVQAEPPVAVCLACKGASLWTQVFPGTEPGRVMRASEIEALGVRTIVGDDFLPDSLRAWAAGAGVAIQPPCYDPVAVAEASLERACTGPVLPLYAREPEAVTRWRSRGGEV
ncbi:MAG: tRNA (adenosine(37)-N6)-threonylcarbamoyltransferase complex dimerization subunit type 1 TsaB [Planctomycetota bacterium]|nr:MAG: tRNA (adenosine(37)-N6)-threonylcarbamoyltransferase complex dimerization subunit type 1 TsaB [Planctomycetota bacterium]